MLSGGGSSLDADVRNMVQKNFGIFEIYGLSARTREERGFSLYGHFVNKEEGGSIFRDFCGRLLRTYFMTPKHYNAQNAL